MEKALIIAIRPPWSVGLMTDNGGVIPDDRAEAAGDAINSRPRIYMLERIIMMQKQNNLGFQELC